MTGDSAFSYSYRAYGYNLKSDIPFAQLLPGVDPFLDTITIRRVETLPEAPDDLQQIGPYAYASANYLALQVHELVDFVALDGKTLLYCPHPNSDQASLQVFLLGSGLGALLMQREFLVLHGNSVEIDGACIVCVGPSGVGKSTTAAGLMKRGFRVLSDDVCAVNSKSQIVPGIPHLKLWQEAAEGLQLETEGLSRIRPELAKYRIPMDDAFCANPIAIKTIYLLTPHQSDAITCDTITGHSKFSALRNNTYRLRYVQGLGLGAVHFRQLTELAKTVTVKRVQRPSSGFHLDRLLDVLVADAQGQEQH